jgi:hypothetical protein
MHLPERSHEHISEEFPEGTLVSINSVGVMLGMQGKHTEAGKTYYQAAQ